MRIDATTLECISLIYHFPNQFSTKKTPPFRVFLSKIWRRLSLFTFPVPPFTTIEKTHPKLRKVRRAAEQELFDLANRGRSAEVMMGVVFFLCVFTPFFSTTKTTGIII